MRLFGHPVHAMMVAFPIALFCLAPLCDLIALVAAAPELAEAGRLCLIGGSISSAPALVTGFVDFLRIEQRSPAMRTAIWHGALAFTAASLFATALALRGSGAPRGFPLALELLGAGLIGAVGWLGGHLVFHHGVGVRRDPAPRVDR